MIERLKQMDHITRIQYALMLLFGGLCLAAAVSPLDELTKTTLATLFFGLTAGLWLSHLIGVLARTVDAVNEP